MKPPDSANSLGLRAQARRHLIDGADLQTRTAEKSLDSIVHAADLITRCFRDSRKVMICGNGGSAADAQHIAAEFVNQLSQNLQRPGLPAIALTTDTSFLTAYANDRGYDGVFERQVLTLGVESDVLMAISTSGNSTNVIKAVEAARGKKMKTLALAGAGGKLAGLVDVAIVVPSKDTQHVQEVLLAIEHVICLLVERSLFGSNGSAA